MAKRIQEQQIIKLVPIGDEYFHLREMRHFNTAFIDTHMDLTIKFQLVSVNGKFIIMHARTADKVSTCPSYNYNKVIYRRIEMY